MEYHQGEFEYFYLKLLLWMRLTWDDEFKPDGPRGKTLNVPKVMALL